MENKKIVDSLLNLSRISGEKDDEGKNNSKSNRSVRQGVKSIGNKRQRDVSQKTSSAKSGSKKQSQNSRKGSTDINESSDEKDNVSEQSKNLKSSKGSQKKAETENDDTLTLRRKKHNEVEVRRRKRMNERFTQLRILSDCKSTNKISILTSAIEKIQSLMSNEERNTHTNLLQDVRNSLIKMENEDTENNNESKELPKKGGYLSNSGAKNLLSGGLNSPLHGTSLFLNQGFPRQSMNSGVFNFGMMRGLNCKSKFGLSSIPVIPQVNPLSARRCLLCYENRCNTLFFPCHHSLYCGSCITRIGGCLKICGECRAPIEGLLQFVPQDETDSNNSKCIICEENQRDVIFSPCNHLFFCSGCTSNTKRCPKCMSVIHSRTPIVKTEEINSSEDSNNMGMLLAASRSEGSDGSSKQNKFQNTQTATDLSSAFSQFSPIYSRRIVNHNLKKDNIEKT